MDQQWLTNRKLRVEDFQKSGRFESVQIPYHPPVPKEIMQYVFRTKDGHEFNKDFEFRFLQHIHNLKGTKTELCEDCGEHLINCGKYINLAPELKPMDVEADSDIQNNQTEASSCDCDVQ
jgi:hypothetical protein